MAVDTEEEAFTERCTMRETVQNRQKLLVNEKVEVRSIEEGFQGSWHSGTVIGSQKEIRRVQYDRLLRDDGNENLIDCVEASAMVDGIITTNTTPPNYRGWIRPLPPHLHVGEGCLYYGQCVDVFHQEAWWEGVIFDHEVGFPERLIFFPDMGDELKVQTVVLRITQDWDEINEDWKPRGNWLFLEVIEEIEQEWPLLVSVKQIWYEVRIKTGFENLKEWTSSLRDIWKELTLQVILDNLKFTMKEFFRKFNIAENLSRFTIDDLVNSKAYFGCSVAIVPFEPTCQLNIDALQPAGLKKACSKPVEVQIVRHDMPSCMESGGLDKNPLISSIKPKHKEALCVHSPGLRILPTDLDELSKFSSADNYDESSSTNSEDSMPKKRNTWLPAGPDIVPGAEFCPDAIILYYNISKAGHMPPKELILNARKHLLYLGWKIEVRKVRRSRLRYTAPGSDGKCYSTLIKVCEHFRESASGIVSPTPQDDHKNFEETVQDDLPSLMNSGSLNRSPLIKPSHEEPLCVHPPALSILPYNLNELSTFSSSNNLEGSSSMMPEVPIPNKWPTWLPAGPDIVPEAEYCPDAIILYYNMSKAGHRPSNGIRLNVRKHISFLGWKIEFLKEESLQRVRYTAPGSDGKCYFSLVKVCENLIESASGIVSPIPQDNQKSLAAASGNLFLSPLTELSPVCNEVHMEPSSSSVIVEPEYCPEAILNYYSLIMKKRSDSCKRKGDLNLKDMKLKVKKHLSAVGWSFYYIFKIKEGEFRKEMRYSSPSKKMYYSLPTACKACIDEERISDGNAHTPRQIISFSKDAEGQVATEALCSTSKSVDVQETFVSQKRVSENHYAEFSGLSWSRELFELGNVKAKGIRKRGKKRKSRRSLASRLHSCSKFLKNGKGIKSRDNCFGGDSTSVLRSSKRARQVVAPSSSHSTPRTILSWLIDNNMVLPRAKVHYRGRDGRSMAEGRVTRDGIKCSCCQDVFTLANFEAHAGSTYHRPSANIFLEDGKSLLDCQSQLNNDINARNSMKKPCVAKLNQHDSTNDCICSVCHCGGELVLCDHCPSSFHTSCLGLKEVPDGDWFCPSCCCKICGQSKINEDREEFTDNSVINCNQCELQYHIGCLRIKGFPKLDGYPKGYWFCNKKCEQIFLGLRMLLGKPVPVGVDNITWTLLKYIKSDSCDHDASSIGLTENYSKLNVALDVMHECFEPVKEPRTGRDLVEDVIFCRWSKLNRLNFRGFYTVLLERNDELITVATVRVYGEKVAEIPLVATRFQYRRLGMCRILMNELEKTLVELGVERLVLPAVPSVLDTWTSSFGFSEMTQSERLKFLDYSFLDFQGTIMCEKLLLKPSMELISLSRTQQLCGDIKGNDNMDLDGSNAVSEVFQAAQIEDSGIVDQRDVDQNNRKEVYAEVNGNETCASITQGSGNHYDNGAAPVVVMVSKPTPRESMASRSEISSVEAADYKGEDNHGDDHFKYYKRRKMSAVGAEVSTC